MAKNRLGIKIFGILFVCLGAISLCAYIFRLYPNIKGMYAPRTVPVFALLFILIGIGILILKNWARLGIIFLSTYFGVVTSIRIFIWFKRFSVSETDKVSSIIIAAILTLLFYLGIIYYFMRPQIKELFKNKE